MGLRQSPPGDRGDRGHIYWQHVSTPRGIKAWTAWIAGPVLWFKCHQLKRTKPCIEEITDGELECPWCAGGVPKHTMGYIPLYRELDAKPCYELLYDDAREDLDRLKLHERVMVGRGPGKTDTVYVMKCSVQTPVWQTRDPQRMRPADLTTSLLRMWAIPILIQWYSETERVSIPAPKATALTTDTAVTLPEAVAAKEVPPEDQGDVGPMYTAAMRRAKERSKAWVEDVKKGSSNGKKPH